jgi:hypothetical protein
MSSQRNEVFYGCLVGEKWLINGLLNGIAGNEQGLALLGDLKIVHPEPKPN